MSGGRRVGYVLIIAISVGVGVGVYRLSANLPVLEQDPKTWVVGAGAAPAEQAPPPPPTNFERLSITDARRTWHDRLIGSLGLVVAVSIAAAALAFAVYLAGSTVIGLLEKAAT
jgi:hypothetical protein